MIGDLNTSFSFHPDWVTHAVDHLPGIRTTAPSDFNVQAEVGLSLPNPNTRNQVYIDDMEGVRDAVSLSMTPERWRWSGVPSRQVGNTNKLLTDPSIAPADTNVAGLRNAEVHWFSPYSFVKEWDLKPTLSQAEGGNNSRQVLAISVPKRPQFAKMDDELWVGLTYPLDINGIDLSKSQFIELWVDDFNDAQRIRNRDVKLHIDLGVVSEDQMRSSDLKAERESPRHRGSQQGQPARRSPARPRIPASTASWTAPSW